MLKVYKNSWHYKLAYNKLSAHIFNQKEPKDLCTYMRQVFKPAFWFMTLLFAICGSVYDIHMLSLYGGEDWVWPEVSVFVNIPLLIMCALGWGLMFIVSIVTAVAILVIAGHFFQEILWEPFKVRREEIREHKEPRPNLFWEWCKAQKQRVCPLVEVVED